MSDDVRYDTRKRKDLEWCRHPSTYESFKYRSEHLLNSSEHKAEADEVGLVRAGGGAGVTWEHRGSTGNH